MQRPLHLDHDGQTIRGTAYLVDETRRPTVVLLHGFTGHRIETGFLFVQLARALTV